MDKCPYCGKHQGHWSNCPGTLPDVPEASPERAEPRGQSISERIRTMPRGPERDRLKALNFAEMYGAGPKTLASIASRPATAPDTNPPPGSPEPASEDRDSRDISEHPDAQVLPIQGDRVRTPDGREGICFAWSPGLDGIEPWALVHFANDLKLEPFKRADLERLEG